MVSKPLVSIILDETAETVECKGVILKSAEQNPWYILATIFDSKKYPDPIALKNANRRMWNGWACRDLSSQEKMKLAEAMEIDASHFSPLSVAQQSMMEEAFKQRLPNKKLPDPAAEIDFSHTHFPNSTSFTGFVFLPRVKFDGSEFMGEIDFSKAQFEDYVSFYDCKVGRGADFSGANFQGLRIELGNFGTVDFSNAEFLGQVICESVSFGGKVLLTDATFHSYTSFSGSEFNQSDFLLATFKGKTEFRETRFRQDCSFRFSHFEGFTIFLGAIFERRVDFSNCTFRSSATFKGAVFLNDVPRFFESTMFPDTVFEQNKKLWPKANSANAETGAIAYMRLRQIADDARNVDYMLFFLRQEFRCKEQVTDAFHAIVIRLYRWISDCGNSVLRPFLSLVYLWSFGAGVFTGYFGLSSDGQFPATVTESPLISGAGLAFSNLLSFLGLSRLYYSEILASLPTSLKFLAGAQTVIGVVLLFFLGLGLRSRFRLR